MGKLEYRSNKLIQEHKEQEIKRIQLMSEERAAIESRHEQLLEQLGEYEQEIYEKDLIIQGLQETLDLYRFYIGRLVK
jgi:hypothetical protein